MTLQHVTGPQIYPVRPSHPILSQAGAFVDALDDSGSSPLLLAASQRDFTMVTWNGNIWKFLFFGNETGKN